MKKKIIVLTCFFCLFLPAKAQVWHALGVQLWGGTNYDAKTFDGALWVCHAGDATYKTIMLSEWTGQIWKDYPVYKDSGNPNSVVGIEMEKTGNYIFVLCQIDYPAQKYKLLRYDMLAKTWLVISLTEPYLNRPGTIAREIEIYNGQLYIAGSVFNSSFKNMLLAYHPTNDTLSEYGYINGTVNSVSTHNNRLILGGSWDSLGATNIPNLAYFDGFVFDTVPGTGMSAPVVQKIAKLGPDTLLLFEPGSSPRLSLLAQNLRLNITSNLDSVNALHSAVSVNGQLMASVNIAPHIYAYGSTWNTVSSGISPFQQYQLIESGNKVYAIPVKQSNTALQEPDIRVMGAVKTIRGRLYVDVNSFKCSYSTGDIPLKNIMLVDSSRGYSGITDNQGFFEVLVDTGTVNLTFPGKGSYDGSPCTFPFPLNVNISDQVITRDIALNPRPGFRDVSCRLAAHTGWRARQGFLEGYELTVKNESYISNDGIVNLHLPTGLLPDSMPGADSVYGNTVSWRLNLAPYESRNIYFGIRTPLSMPLNSSLDLYAAADFSGDQDQQNNTDSLFCRVTAAYDPNDKQCFPFGNLLPATARVKYHIRFQNTGNDTAYRVTVVDTLDLNLPLVSVRMRSSSHAYKFSTQSNNVLIWVFDNIMLPDSNRDVEKSQGFLEYEINIRPGMKPGDSIRNTAYIYFDYQIPVVTNTVVTGFTDKNSLPKPGNKVSWTLYPNPAGDRFFIQHPGWTGEVQIFDVTGREIWAGQLDEETSEISTAGWQAGYYFIRARGLEKALKIAVMP